MNRGRIMLTNFKLFVYTVDEYKRFAQNLSVKTSDSMVDEYTENDYIGIQVRLMLLRKYYCKGKDQNVSIENLLKKAKEIFTEKAQEIEDLLREYESISQQQIENILSDGTKLNLYETIEDTIYGLYLHADENRINKLMKTTESIRFVCIRKYVLDIESILYKIYDFFKREGVSTPMANNMTTSPLIYLGNTSNNSQEIKKSQYWKNAYGHDVTDDEALEALIQNSTEEMQILIISYLFLECLKESTIPIDELRKYVHPATLKSWRDFKEAQEYYASIPNPGVSSRVRYNKNRDTAYVRILPNVEEAFCVDTPHIFEDIYEIALGKHLGIWKIFSFGGHLDSIYK